MTFRFRALFAALPLFTILASGCGGNSHEDLTDPTPSADAGTSCQTNTDCPAGAPVCDPAASACVACLVDAQCPVGEKCRARACVIPTTCSSSLDCAGAPTTTICDPATSTCVACVGAADCPTAADCIHNECVPYDPCATSLDCPSGEVCDPAHGRCVGCLTDVDCGGGEVCVGGECITRTPCGSDNQCTPLGQLCDKNLGYCVDCLTAAQCPEGTLCSAGICQLSECAPGSTFCVGGELRRCDGDGSGSTVLQACAANERCDAVQAICVALLCAPNAPVCNGTTATTCNPDGTAYGVGGTDCAAQGKTCSAGVCEDGPVDPDTCAQAEADRSHVGCDFWPTVTANNVWSIFDFAVLVANAGQQTAEVSVTGPNAVNINLQILAGASQVIYLPWVAALKGPDSDNCGSAAPISATVTQPGGAYHLVSTRPVAVYQFNALEYKGEGGPPGKSWSACPGNQTCASLAAPVGCFSFSNDASLLMPSTSMTGNYRLAGASAWDNQGAPFMPTYAAVTATQPGTTVEIRAAGRILAGGGVPALQPGQTATVTLNAGDVLQVVGGNAAGDDLSGSMILASKPVQVITGMPCRNVPIAASACDHIEESVLPVETWGKEYVVTVPAAPSGQGAAAVGHVVRLVGNADGTIVHFDPPISAPGVTNGQATLQAGGVLDLGQQASDFKVWSADKSFIVLTLQLGATLVDPTTDPFGTTASKGDPSQSFVSPSEQFRTKYVFSAPPDYVVSFVSIVGTPDSGVTIDGVAVPPSAYAPIGGSGMGVVRRQLTGPGTHRLESLEPVGIQVYGYGDYTSYQVPGGLGLHLISPAPQ